MPSFTPSDDLMEAQNLTICTRRRHTPPPVLLPGELDERYDFGPLVLLYENTRSSTKPEVHNVLHCRQRTTDPRPQVAYTENFVKFGYVFEICERTDRQTDKHTDTQIAKERSKNGSRDPYHAKFEENFCNANVNTCYRISVDVYKMCGKSRSECAAHS